MNISNGDVVVGYFSHNWDEKRDIEITKVISVAIGNGSPIRQADMLVLSIIYEPEDLERSILAQEIDNPRLLASVNWDYRQNSWVSTDVKLVDDNEWKLEYCIKSLGFSRRRISKGILPINQ